jgi:hypothetical protein
VGGLIGEQADEREDVDSIDRVPARSAGVQPEAGEEVVDALGRQLVISEPPADVRRCCGGTFEKGSTVTTVGAGAFEQQLEACDLEVTGVPSYTVSTDECVESPTVLAHLGRSPHTLVTRLDLLETQTHPVNHNLILDALARHGDRAIGEQAGQPSAHCNLRLIAVAGQGDRPGRIADPKSLQDHERQPCLVLLALRPTVHTSSGTDTSVRRSTAATLRIRSYLPMRALPRSRNTRRTIGPRSTNAPADIGPIREVSTALNA